MPTLTSRMTKYVLAKDKSGWNKSAYNSRLQKYAIQGLEDLTLLAQKLPEKQLQKIFNEKTLGDLFKALLNINISAKDHEEWKEIKKNKEMLIKRRRLLRICRKILMLIGDYNFTANLVPSNWKPWLGMEYPPISNLKAILYTQLNDDAY
ncbi:MAG: hypothetical protein OEW62_00920 [Candidatus Bathyarchaeota archaeon]|nr:hypothetical protein [Candidatus Bathyarchaeota archaeon]